MAWAVPLSAVLWLLITWAAWGKPVGVYAIVSVCSPNLLICRVEPPVRFDTWEECETYLLAVEREGIVLGRCRSWSPPFDWREE